MKRTTNLFLMFAFGTMLVSCGSNETKREEPVVRVTTETVQSSADMGEREYVGEVEEESATSVSFTGSGTIVKMAVSEGQHVSKGQLIAELDPTQCKNAVAVAEAMLRQAKDAEARMKKLHDAKSLADMKWVEVESQVQQAESQLEMARKALADCRVYAPCSGVIGKGVSHAGETALPAMPIAKILNISGVKIKVSIPEKEIAGFTHDTKTLIIVDALGGKQFSGGAIEKGVEGSGITHTYDIKVNVPNSKGELLPGMVCKVKTLASAIPASGVNAITVPITSVHKNAKGEHFVWVVKDKKASRRIVEKGHPTGNRIMITKGLNSGDVIVTEGHQKLSEGTKTSY